MLYCAAGQEYWPVGSYGLDALATPPFNAKPNRQFTFLRHGSSSLPAGAMLALTTEEAAPTPCRRTGFHINSISL